MSHSTAITQIFVVLEKNLTIFILINVLTLNQNETKISYTCWGTNIRVKHVKHVLVYCCDVDIAHSYVESKQLKKTKLLTNYGEYRYTVINISYCSVYSIPSYIGHLIKGSKTDDIEPLCCS